MHESSIAPKKKGGARKAICGAKSKALRKRTPGLHTMLHTCKKGGTHAKKKK